MTQRTTPRWSQRQKEILRELVRRMSEAPPLSDWRAWMERLQQRGIWLPDKDRARQLRWAVTIRCRELTEEMSALPAADRRPFEKRIARLDGYVKPRMRKECPTAQVATLAALEDWLAANPQLTWAQLSEKYKVWDVARHVRHLRSLLRAEGIPLPEPSDYLSIKQCRRVSEPRAPK
jgi:hypothetical protein